MQSIRSISPVVRAIGVIGAVAILVTSITYAALQSQVTLTDNTITTGSANLEIASFTAGDPGACGAFGATAPGFAFAGVIPGGASSQTEKFCLSNTSTTNGLSLKVKSVDPVTWTAVPSTATVDNTKVTLDIVCDNGSTISTTVAAIELGDVSFSATNLAANTQTTCTAKITMDAAAFTGESATAGQFDLMFTGTAV